MAQAVLQIAGRRYDVACREGEQAHFEALGRMIDAKAREAAGAVGGINEARQLVLAALLLADELYEAREGIVPATDAAAASALASLAKRIEALADRLEKERADA